jgi:hypothetical protein
MYKWLLAMANERLTHGTMRSIAGSRNNSIVLVELAIVFVSLRSYWFGRAPADANELRMSEALSAKQPNLSHGIDAACAATSDHHRTLAEVIWRRCWPVINRPTGSRSVRCCSDLFLVALSLCRNTLPMHMAIRSNSDPRQC